MPPSQQARINLNELTAKLKALGPDKESQYLSLFSRFLSRRLTKAELQRQVVLTIGREYVALHNQLIKAIVHNASGTEPPLAAPVTETTSKPVRGIKRKPAFITLDEPFSAPRSNGDVVVGSSRKNRTSGVRKVSKERQSVLGFVKQDEFGGDTGPEDGVRIQGRAGVDFLRPVQQLQDAAEQPDTDSLGSVTKRSRMIISVGQPDSRASPSEDAAEEQQLALGLQQQQHQLLQQQECILLNTWPVRPPLGTPFCVGSIGAAQRPSLGAFRPGLHHHHLQQQHLTHSLLGDSIDEECLEAGDVLPDGEGMRRRMEQIAIEQGLQGVSPESGHLLNHALDIYLKRLIAASVAFVQSRRSERPQQQQQLSSSGSFDPSKREVMLQTAKLSHVHGLNGVWPGSHSHQQQHQQQQQQQVHQQMLSSSADVDSQSAPISISEFKMTMDCNTKLLGENRSTHLERISLRVFEQQQRQVLH